MVKIIFITFAVMAFALYEISGGDAFVPLAEEKRAALETERVEEERARAIAKAEQIKLAPQPAEIILSSTVTTAPKAQIDADEAIAAVTAALEADKLEEVAGDEIVFASLETVDGNASTLAAAFQLAPDVVADIREVTAARVNMRNGPGQNFTAVAKLNSGEQVEILQDPGDGWVKLRVSQSGRVGWMADFLLTASNTE